MLDYAEIVRKVLVRRVHIVLPAVISAEIGDQPLENCMSTQQSTSEAYVQTQIWNNSSLHQLFTFPNSIILLLPSKLYEQLVTFMMHSLPTILHTTFGAFAIFLQQPTNSTSLHISQLQKAEEASWLFVEFMEIYWGKYITAEGTFEALLADER